MIYVLLTVPLHSLQINYGKTSDAQPLSNAYKNQITHFKTCMTLAAAKLPAHNIFDLTSSHFDSYCMSISHNHKWLPPVLPSCHCTYAPACH
jgi:hypothetical protein